MIVCPIFAALPSHQQIRVFEPTPPGCRKVVLATNIAETSITIDGIRFIVDCGFVKLRSHNARIGTETLVVQPISKAAARQRAGRAGRQGPGLCYRLYPESAFEELPENTPPEILRCNLSGILLLLKATTEIDNILAFEFLDRPPREACTSEPAL